MRKQTNLPRQQANKRKQPTLRQRATCNMQQARRTSVKQLVQRLFSAVVVILYCRYLANKIVVVVVAIIFITCVACCCCC